MRIAVAGVPSTDLVAVVGLPRVPASKVDDDGSQVCATLTGGKLRITAPHCPAPDTALQQLGPSELQKRAYLLLGVADNS